MMHKGLRQSTSSAEGKASILGRPEDRKRATTFLRIALSASKTPAPLKHCDEPLDRTDVVQTQKSADVGLGSRVDGALARTF